jgi:hypothetical protein
MKVISPTAMSAVATVLPRRSVSSAAHATPSTTIPIGEP